jgi:predicted HTH domain antitoxin
MSVQQAEQAILVELPRDTLAPIAESPDAFAKEMRLAAGMLWYLQGRVSHERAAQFAGISRIAFIDALAAAKLPAFHVDVDEFMEEVRDAREALRQHIARGVPGEGGSPGDPAVGGR